MKIGGRARIVHESNVFIALGLASGEKQVPQIVEKIVHGANSGGLVVCKQGHRFDPGHVHHISNQLRLGGSSPLAHL